MFSYLIKPLPRKSIISFVLYYLKTFIIIFLLIRLSSSTSTSVNDAVDVLYAQSNGRLSEAGAAFIRRNFVYHVEPCRKIPDDGGGLWRCVYSSGLIVYNCFRKCRGSIEAGRYFLGISGGDCDSFTIVNGKQKTVCYPQQADALFRNHGQVIAIERIGPCLR